MMARRILSALTVLTSTMIFVSCSKKPDLVISPIFYGECQVRVLSKTKGAEIQVDGIRAGFTDILVNVPCGEKQITVLKDGFSPYRDYIRVTKGNSLDVTVELQALKHTDDYALSDLLVEQVKKGEALKNPNTTHKARVAINAPLTDNHHDAAASAAPAVKSGEETVDDWR